MWSHVILDVSVRALLGQCTLCKADCPPKVGGPHPVPEGLSRTD